MWAQKKMTVPMVIKVTISARNQYDSFFFSRSSVEMLIFLLTLGLSSCSSSFRLEYCMVSVSGRCVNNTGADELCR